MTLPAIEVTGLSKRYIIGHQTQKDDGLRHVLQRGLTKPFRWAKNGFRSTSTTLEEFWAIKDISFSVRPGEVVGVIGRNGAGKSTLLKVLSRITEQTQGRIHLRGRTASLLEVGTGFHPELTGRENIYLNGAILGMGRNEIKRKFDEIVDFAEVEKFLDTPVKRYSSGMYVRLAFGVAAHLDPEILIIDEVLAVGDAEFQRKCLGKMNQAAEDGRTVLFVSHNMATVQSLCTRAIYLKEGQVVEDAPVEQALATYSTAARTKIDAHSIAERTDREGGDEIRMTGVKIIDTLTQQPALSVRSGQDITIQLEYECLAQEPVTDVSLGFAVFKSDSTFMFACTGEGVGQLVNAMPGKGVFRLRVRKWPLLGGQYHYNVSAIKLGRMMDLVREAGLIDCETGDYYGTSKLPGVAKRGVLIDYEAEHQEMRSAV